MKKFIYIATITLIVISILGVHLGAINPVIYRSPNIKLKNGTSSNWSGYAIQTNLSHPQNNAVSDVQGQWTVPSLSCNSSSAYSSAWVGIDGYSDGTVEQIGTEQDCRSGVPVYLTWFEMYPKMSRAIGLAINPGDVIKGEVKYIGNYSFMLSLSNITTGQSFATIQRSKAARNSAEWIVEAPWSGGVLPLANFGTFAFTNSSATLNGHTGTINDSGWQNDVITMATSSGVIKALPSGLSTDGRSFTIAWESN